MMLDNYFPLLPFFGMATIAGLFALVLYVYLASAWYTIAKKLNYHKAWLAWIPFLNIIMVLQMGSFHWAWFFLLFVPVLGWAALFVLMIISSWRIYELRKYPGWLALLVLGSWVPFLGWFISVANLVVIGLVAWRDGGIKAAKVHHAVHKSAKKSKHKAKRRR